MPDSLPSSSKPHLYFWQGRWWITRNGRVNWRRGLTLNDREVTKWGC